MGQSSAAAQQPDSPPQRDKPRAFSIGRSKARSAASGSGSSAELVAWKTSRRWDGAFGKKQLSIERRQGGRVGLSNLGNTCFMNSGLQCLSHLEPLVAYFLTDKYLEEINESNKMGSGGNLARAFAKLQEQLWQKGSRSQSPKELHRTLCKFAPHLFEGYQQQDAQEFLAYLLDGLHEDINLVRNVPKHVPSGLTEAEEDDQQRQLEREKGEEYVAALSWAKHLTRQKSFFVDLFQGQLRSRVKCSRCDLESKTYDPYLYMSVPVHDKMRTLEEALSEFVREETLQGNEQWKCPKCNKCVDATKKIDIWKLPPILVVHLKRFEFDQRSHRFRKISADLRSPLTIDLSSFVGTQTKEAQIYDVVGVCNHSGSFGGGHYTATCRHPVDKRFYHFNDDQVEEIKDESKVLSSRAYLLFLERCPSDNDEMLPRQSVSHPELWPHVVSERNSVMLSAVRDLGGQDPSPSDDTSV